MRRSYYRDVHLRLLVMPLIIIFGCIMSGCNQAPNESNSNTISASNTNAKADKADSHESLYGELARIDDEMVLGEDFKQALSAFMPKTKVRGVALVKHTGNFFIVAVDFGPAQMEAQNISPIVYLAGHIFVDNSGHPYWRLQLFAKDSKEAAKLIFSARDEREKAGNSDE